MVGNKTAILMFLGCNIFHVPYELKVQIWDGNKMKANSFRVFSSNMLHTDVGASSHN